MLRLHVLCSNGICPDKRGGNSAYYVTDGVNAVVLDFGSGACTALDTLNPQAPVNAIILSHLHGDHMSDMLPLKYLLARPGAPAYFSHYAQDTGFPVYLPREDCAERGLLEKGFALKDIDEKTRLVFGALTLTFFPTVHPRPTYGVRIEAGGKTLVYTSDTVYFPGLATACRGADSILADCAVPDEMHNEKSPHMSVAQGAALCAECGSRLIVTHLIPNNTPVIPSDAVLALPGMTIEI